MPKFFFAAQVLANQPQASSNSQLAGRNRWRWSPESHHLLLFGILHCQSVGKLHHGYFLLLRVPGSLWSFFEVNKIELNGPMGHHWPWLLWDLMGKCPKIHGCFSGKINYKYGGFTIAVVKSLDLSNSNCYFTVEKLLLCTYKTVG